MTTAQHILKSSRKPGRQSISREPGKIPSVHAIGSTMVEWFDIVALLHDVSEAGRLIAGGKPVAIMDITSSDPVMIHSDYVRVRWIMMGLMSNAARFTDRGRITLILDRDGDHVRLTIADTGRGIEQKQIDALLEKSDQGFDGAVNGSAACCLGLRIVDAFVKQLHGNLSIASKVGAGTIVVVSLPVS